MKNLQLLMALTILLMLGCEPPVKTLPGVYALEKKANSPNTYIATLNKADILADINQGRVANLSVDSYQYKVRSLCEQLTKAKNDCLAAANGNWDGTGDSLNGLGSIDCCNDYYDEKISACFGQPQIAYNASNLFALQTFFSEKSENPTFPLEITLNGTNKKNPQVAFISRNNAPHFVLTYQEEENGETINRGYWQNLNYAAPTPTPLENAIFVDKGSTVSPKSLLINSDLSIQTIDKPFPEPDTSGTLAFSCGSQGTDRPIGGGRGETLLLLESDCVGGCSGSCIARSTEQKDLEMYIHLVVPKQSMAEYIGEEIVVQEYFTTKSAFQSIGLDSLSVYDFFGASTLDFLQNPTVRSLPQNMPTKIKRDDFKPYLLNDDGECSEELKLYAAQITIDIELKLRSSFISNSDSILILVAQILNSNTLDPSDLLMIEVDNPHDGGIPSRLVLENEVLLVFSQDDSPKFQYNKKAPPQSIEFLNNIYLCPMPSIAIKKNDKALD